ncbi:MAG: hypothetical protein ACE5E9_08310 [Nitrospinaceae bacterium]
MNLELKKVSSEQDKKKFIRLPWAIYNDNPLWVPPLLVERKKFLDPQINPFFEHAEVELYLVHSTGGEPVGRVALIGDRAYNEFHSENVGFIGMFECIEDQAAANLLLDTAHDWCRSRGFQKMMGPMNLSTNHECGLLVEGFDIPPMIGIPFNPPYYPDLFTQWGMVKAKDLLSLKLHPKKIPDYLERAMAKIRKRGHFTLRHLRLNRFDQEIDILWEVYNSAWSRNWGFVPMTRKEFGFAAKEMNRIILPDLCFVAEVKGQPAGFSLSLPNINQALKSMNGKIFPFGLVKYHLNKKKIDGYRVLTLGVKKNFQNMGIDVGFYYETYKWLAQNQAALIEMSWILEDNRAMLGPIRRIGGKVYKRHRIYERICRS